MTEYAVQHLESGEQYTRPWSLKNAGHNAKSFPQEPVDPAVEAFHRTLPDYNETKLYDLGLLAKEIGVAHVFIKDESTRFGLPAFKVLGASWAIHRSICKHLGIPASTALDELIKQLSKNASNQIRLVTCSGGNWGRACGRMAKILRVPITIYVPGFMSEYTQNLLRGEGAEVKVLQDGSYDDSIAATKRDAQSSGALMVMDTSWDDYTEIPKWVTEGYSTMLTETDRQIAALLPGAKPNVFIVSVGVGSWAHSVVAYYKAADPNNRILTVEPETAASFKESLHVGQITPIQTGETIMAGMNCGTTSQLAWPILQAGVTAAVTVTDRESHESVQYLEAAKVNAGPCGAATLAALRKYANTLSTEERREMVVVLFSTEGRRDYEVPV
ncbi:putative pyridoxal-phosphate dependent enzyme [Septoria linicola]|nr:putative pyridoxal-phosphate dependent enzyme [Septoria linicola]